MSEFISMSLRINLVLAFCMNISGKVSDVIEKGMDRSGEASLMRFPSNYALRLLMSVYLNAE